MIIIIIIKLSYYFMNNQNKKLTFKQKISNYFSFFCGGNNNNTQIKVDDFQKIDRRASLKNKRISFILDRALIKMSRKNLKSQQFSTDALMRELLQTHISTRVPADTFVLYQGNFSDKIMKQPLFSIKMIDIAPSAFSKNNIILLKPNQSFKLRSQLADTLVRQIVHNIIQQIQLALKDFHNIITTFIFIKYQGIDISQLHELFIAFKDLYLFQIERVMILQKCYATVIYISKLRQRLNIDDHSLVQFYMQELIKKDNHLQKVDFPFMLSQLIQNGLCIQVASTIGQIMVTQKSIQQYDKQFIYLIHQRYPKSHQIIEQYLNTIKAESTNISQIHDKVPHFYQNTPLFNQKQEQGQEDKQKKAEKMMTFQSMKKSFLSFGIKGDFD